jgi:hypothetical protein
MAVRFKLLASLRVTTQRINKRTKAVWSWCVAAVLLVAVSIAAILLWPRKGCTEANIGAIGAGMPQVQVEAILGPPSQKPTLNQGEAFWDAHCYLGFKYISVTFSYDADGMVKSKMFYEAWRNLPVW